MDQAAHTPGPWRLAPATAYSDSELNIDAGPNGTADYICCAGHRGDLNAEANARLIAAAPELLAALKLVREFNCKHAPALLSLPLFKSMDAAVFAAIAKAA